MDKWVEFRRQIIKRPFLATLERFVNPVKAQIIIASAFHLPYGAKMIKIAEQAGFPGIIIIRSGLEGTIAFALKRPVKILCSAKQKDGRYVREESVFNPEEYSGRWVAVEEKLQYPSLEKNAELIEAYKTHGQTKYELFDLRVKATCAGIKQTIGWIEKIESKK
jgi:anthranilate phosphoribosyltransferase